MKRPANNRGISLIITMLFLALLTMLSLASIQRGFFSEKLAGNILNRHLAFEGADTALLEAEWWLSQQTVVPAVSDPCDNPPCTIYTADFISNPTNQGNSWWLTYGTQASTANNSVAQSPRYIIQFIGQIGDALGAGLSAESNGGYYYRITARSYGGNTRSEAIVESVYSIRFD